VRGDSIESTYRVPEPVRVTLARVYDIDFGQRDEDVPTWLALAATAIPGPVVEVGVGDGRVARHLVAAGREVHGIDVDRDFLSRARQRGVVPHHGSAADSSTWAEVPPCGLAICAYSTLYLVPHDLQAGVVRAMAAALLPGGTFAVEVFVPSADAPRPVDVSVGDPSEPAVRSWTRRTLYDVDFATRTTRATRWYGPEVGNWRMQLDETIYWRWAEDVHGFLVRDAGLRDARITRSSPGSLLPVARGSIVATWRKPMPRKAR